MKITEITDNKDKILQLNVFPDVIKNRFDVLHSVVENRGGYTLYCIENNMQKHIFPFFQQYFMRTRVLYAQNR